MFFTKSEITASHHLLCYFYVPCCLLHDFSVLLIWLTMMVIVKERISTTMYVKAFIFSFSINQHNISVM